MANCPRSRTVVIRSLTTRADWYTGRKAQAGARRSRANGAAAANTASETTTTASASRRACGSAGIVDRNIGRSSSVAIGPPGPGKRYHTDLRIGGGFLHGERQAVGRRAHPGAAVGGHERELPEQR